MNKGANNMSAMESATIQQSGELPDHHKLDVERGLTAYARVQSERDELQRLYDAKAMECKFLETELTAKALALTVAQNDVATYKTDRDVAVQNCVKMETYYRNLISEIGSMFQRGKEFSDTFPVVPPRPVDPVDQPFVESPATGKD